MLSQQDLEFRRDKIGASDAPVIMGLSPYKTRYQLWKEKISGVFQEPNAAMIFGNENEDFARSLFESEIDCVLLKTNKPIIHPRRAWQFATLDGMDFEGNFFVEIKCANSSDHALVKEGNIPQKHYPQLQHQYEVSGLNQGYFVSFHQGEIEFLPVTRDEEFIRNMNSQEEEFYLKHIKEKIPPEKVEADYEIEEKKAIHMDCLEWDLASQKYKHIYENLKYYEEQEKLFREELIALSGNRNCFGNGVSLTQVTREGMIDYRSIPELQNVNLDQYRKKSNTSWRLTIK